MICTLRIILLSWLNQSDYMKRARKKRRETRNTYNISVETPQR